MSNTNLFDCETKDRKRPIDIAAEYGNLDILKHLFDIQEFKKFDGKQGTVALINAAVCHRESEVLSFLKKQHKHMLHRHLNTLHFACRQLHGHKMVLDLIDERSIMYQDKQTGSSPLMVAVQHRQAECVKQLLSHEACTQEVIQLVSSVTLRTVFHICAEVNQEEITKQLCQPCHLSSLVVLAADILGDTPLHICAKVDNALMSKLLLDYMKNKSPSREITASSTSTKYRSMTNLDANGRVPSKPVINNAHTTNQQTSPVEHIHTTLLKKNKNKYTPLHVAIYNGNLDVIQEILQYSNLRVINACDDQMRTSLHMAAEKGEKVLNCDHSVTSVHNLFYNNNVIKANYDRFIEFSTDDKRI
jgi:ankyrin repeat protein